MSNDGAKDGDGGVNRRWNLSLGERACAWGIFCGELGVGADLGSRLSMSRPPSTRVAPLVVARAMVRVPWTVWIVRAGVDVETDGVISSAALVLGFGVRW